MDLPIPSIESPPFLISPAIKHQVTYHSIEPTSNDGFNLMSAEVMDLNFAVE